MNPNSLYFINEHMRYRWQWMPIPAKISESWRNDLEYLGSVICSDYFENLGQSRDHKCSPAGLLSILIFTILEGDWFFVY